MRTELLRFNGSVERDPATDASMKEHADELGAIAHQWFEVMRKCGDEVWHRLVPLFSGLHCGHDSHASADLLDLHQHQERFDGPTHARKLYRLPGYVQRPACDISARNVVVWTVRNRPMVRSHGRREDFWQTFHVVESLSNRRGPKRLLQRLPSAPFHDIDVS
jgi:hypothetical protein